MEGKLHEGRNFFSVVYGFIVSAQNQVVDQYIFAE
jgi:hypothetical protein